MQSMSDEIQDVSWRDVAISRRSQLGRRIAYAALGTALVGCFVGAKYGAICMVAILISQLLDAWIWRPVATGRLVRPEKSVIILVSVAQASFVYDLIPIALWTVHDTGLRIFAALWVAGGMLHTTMHMHQNRTAWLYGTGPHMIVFAALPIGSFLFGDMSLANTALAVFGVGLYASHMSGTFRAVSLSAKAREDAREDAVKQREEALAANNAKSAFLATMSHEIRTPLNGVIGLAEVLCGEDLPEKSARHAETIRSSGMMLLQLLNDILDVSKVEAGRLELENTAFNLDDVARKIINLHTPKAREKGIDLEFEIDGDIERVRMGDEYRVAQILHNLVANAVKFTVQGRVTARIKEDGREDWLRIEVEDTGVGMDEEQAEKVFQPFIQADNSVTRKFGGTGLGLSIVKGIVDAMGGRVAVRSTVGRGSTITVAVPLKATTAAPSVEATAFDHDISSFLGMRALVVDDNHVNRLVASSMLSPLEVDAMSADSGEAAIELVKEKNFDLILMDISMPDMDGVEAMLAIRQMLGDAAPPIFAASAHAMKHEVEAYMAKGFDGYLTKPITHAALIDALGKAVAHRAPSSAAHAAG